MEQQQENYLLWLIISFHRETRDSRQLMMNFCSKQMNFFFSSRTSFDVYELWIECIDDFEPLGYEQAFQIGFVLFFFCFAILFDESMLLVECVQCTIPIPEREIGPFRSMANFWLICEYILNHCSELINI